MEMVIKASQVRVSKDGKSAQVVVLVGTGSARKSKTIHVKIARKGDALVAPNPFFSQTEILAGYRHAEKKVIDAKIALRDAQKHERNMLFLSSEKRPWMNPEKGHVELAKSTWYDLAVKETEKAGQALSEAIDNERDVREKFPLTVTFEAVERFTAGNKPSESQKRAA